MKKLAFSFACLALSLSATAEDFRIDSGSIYISKYSKDSQKALSSYLKKKGGVNVGTDIKQADLDILLSKCKSIKNLMISWGNSNITNIDKISGLKSLNNLALSGLSKSSMKPISINDLGKCSKLQYLDTMGTAISGTDKTLKLPALLSADLTDSKLKNIAFFANSPELCILRFRGSNHEFKSYEAFKSLKKLHTLNISRHDQANEKSLLPINSLVSLKDLNMAKCKNVKSFAFLKKNKNIKVIDASDCSRLSDISALANKVSLTYLDITATKVTDLSVLKTCKNLSTLECDKGMDAKQLAELKKALPKLKITH